MKTKSINVSLACLGAAVLCLQLSACGGETQAPVVEKGEPNQPLSVSRI